MYTTAIILVLYFCQARNVMMSSKLPTATLGKVWDLSDIDRDGFLDRYEFTVAMHLVFRALQVSLGLH